MIDGPVEKIASISGDAKVASIGEGAAAGLANGAVGLAGGPANPCVGTSRGENSATQDVIPQTNAIFQQPWWLDAVAPGQWDAIVVQRGHEVVARLPYVVKKKYGLTLLTMPRLTQTLGPWFAASEAKYTNRLSQQAQLCQELIRKLPAHDFFRQSFSPTVSNWLPFYWSGFRASVSYTYRLEDLTDVDRIWADMRENIRREIRKAEKKMHVRDDLGLDSFMAVANNTFTRQGMQVPYDAHVVGRLDAACARRRARRILFAQDAQRNIHAAVYIIWDANTAYYLLGGSNPATRNSGAMSLLLWEAIKFSASVADCFDFEGSMLEPVERFFRGFGAHQVPYFEVWHASRRMRLVMGAAQVLHALTGRAAGLMAATHA